LSFPRSDGPGAEKLKERIRYAINPKSKTTQRDPQFKKQAVQMLNTSGKPLAQVARDLGRFPSGILKLDMENQT
jgi:hypothetical protein